jgi:hypothetical protein
MSSSSTTGLLESLGSIVGIGVGSMDLMLVKTTLQPGETVHGRLMLKLARKTEARRLVVGIEATRERRARRFDPRGHEISSHETETVWKMEQVLEGERAYLDEGYDLHLPIAADALGASLELPDSLGKLGDVMRAVSSIARAVAPPVTWRVFACLEVPWKANIRQHADIVVNAPR